MPNTLPLFEEDPFEDGRSQVPVKREGSDLLPGESHLDYLRRRAATFGAIDLDALVAKTAHTAGKGRRHRPNFKPLARAYYIAQGMTFEDREEKRWLPDAKWPMTLDYKGLFDGVVNPGADEIGVQICSKESWSAHARKMMGTKRGYCGIPRKNLLAWWAEGKRSVILYFWQPKGRGTKWVCAQRELTREDLAAVEAGGRLAL